MHGLVARRHDGAGTEYEEGGRYFLIHRRRGNRLIRRAIRAARWLGLFRGPHFLRRQVRYFPQAEREITAGRPLALESASAAGERKISFRRQGGVPNPVLVSRKAMKFFAGFDIPQAQSFVVGPGEKPLAVRQKRHANLKEDLGNSPVVSLEAAHFLPCFDIPESHHFLMGASRDGEKAIGRESHAADRTRMPWELPQFFAGFHIPETHGGIPGAGEKGMTVRGKG